MTTTEWVERYNRAFREAGLFQDRETKWESMSYLPGKFERLPPVAYRPKVIPPNLSPFETNPGFDPQATDQRGLKPKESPIFIAPEDGYYFIGGYKTFCEAGMEVRAAVANIPDPHQSTDTEIKELVPADETI